MFQHVFCVTPEEIQLFFSPLSTSEVGGFDKETQHLKNRIFESLTFSFLLTPSQQATICFYDEVKSWPTSSAQMRKFRQPAMLPEVLLPLQQNIRRNSQNARQHSWDWLIAHYGHAIGGGGCPWTPVSTWPWMHHKAAGFNTGTSLTKSVMFWIF